MRVLKFLLFVWTVLRIVWLNCRVVLIEFRLNKPKRLEKRRRRLMDRVDRLEARLIDLGW